MASAFIAAARARLLQSRDQDADDDLGTFERIPDKEDRGVELDMNIRYNLRGCVFLVLIICAQHKPLKHVWGAGLGKDEELSSLIKSLLSQICTMILL
jgi:hypothetical protein